MTASTNSIVAALVVARAASNDIVGHFHMLHYCGKSLTDSDRAMYIHKARESAEELLVAILKAEQEIAPVAVPALPNSNVVQIGDHDLEYRHDLCLVAKEMAVK